MQLWPILVCVVSIAQAKLYTKFSKPKLNYIQEYNSLNYKYKPLLPEERRKLPLFPKNPMSYMNSLEPMANMPKPYLEKKKPLMKKIEEIIANNEIKPSKVEDIYDEVDRVESPIVEVDVIKEVSIEIVEDEPEVPEFQNNVSGEQGELSDITESETPIDNSAEQGELGDIIELGIPIYNNDHENTVQLADFILRPKAELEASIQNKSDEALLDAEKTNKSLNENEVDDVTLNGNVSNEESIQKIDNSDKENTVQLEDIILPPETELDTSAETKNGEVLSNVEELNKNTNENGGDNVIDKAIEEESASNEESQDFVTTEISMDPVIYRRKRGSNVIEEENLASTVAVFKYTGRDRRLNNHLAYNNINS